MQSDSPGPAAASEEQIEPSADPSAASQPMGMPVSSEESYQLLVESIQEYAIFMLDHTGCIVTWNVGAQRLFGYPEAEALGQPSSLIFTEDDQAAGAAAAELATARHEGKAEDERWHRRRDGSRFWGSGILTRLTTPDGQVRGFAKILRDNTERQSAEMLLRTLNEQLESMVEERTAQVRTLASLLTLAEQEERRRISQILHDDLQQQLYGIQMRLLFLWTELQSNALLAQHAQEAYNWLGEAIQLTRQITVDLSPPVLKGEGLVDALHWLITQMTQINGLQVTLQADQHFRVVDEDMRMLLFQIVRELLFNVVKHAGTNRATVELRAGTADQLIIIVRDNGRGFDVTRAEAAQGNGFGLFRVRERLGLFGGRMEIDAAPGQGTHITLYVPGIYRAAPP